MDKSKMTTTNDITSIRNIQDSDLNRISEIFCETFSKSPWNEPWTTDKAKERIAQLLSFDKQISFLIEMNDEVVGFIIGHLMNWHDEGYFEIKELCVKHDSKRKGLGSSLLKKVEAELKRLNVKSALLFTNHGNEAHKFYQNQGYGEFKGMALMNKGLN